MPKIYSNWIFVAHFQLAIDVTNRDERDKNTTLHWTWHLLTKSVSYMLTSYVGSRSPLFLTFRNSLHIWRLEMLCVWISKVFTFQKSLHCFLCQALKWKFPLGAIKTKKTIFSTIKLTKFKWSYLQRVLNLAQLCYKI